MGKYFKYAIGEILLVVIGILLALQINNWNEHRKNKESLAIYTNSLIEDFKQDTMTLNGILTLIEQDSQLIDNYKRRLSSDKATNDTLIKIFRDELRIIIKAYRPPNDNTLLAMKANGIIELYDKQTSKLLQELQKNHKITESVVVSNLKNITLQLNSLMAKFPVRDFKVIEGPMAENYWQSIDPHELFIGLEAYLEVKTTSNTFSGNRYLEQVKVTEKVIDRLLSIQEDR